MCARCPHRGLDTETKYWEVGSAPQAECSPSLELSPLRNNSLSSMGANQRDCSCKTESYKQWCYRHAYRSVPMHACVSQYPVLSLSLYFVIVCFLFSLLFIKKPFCIPCNYFTIPHSFHLDLYTLWEWSACTGNIVITDEYHSVPWLDGMTHKAECF